MSSCAYPGGLSFLSSNLVGNAKGTSSLDLGCSPGKGGGVGGCPLPHGSHLGHGQVGGGVGDRDSLGSETYGQCACKSVFIAGGYHGTAMSSRPLSLHQPTDEESCWDEVNDLRRNLIV